METLQAIGSQGDSIFTDCEAEKFRDRENSSQRPQRSPDQEKRARSERGPERERRTFGLEGHIQRQRPRAHAQKPKREACADRPKNKPHCKKRGVEPTPVARSFKSGFPTERCPCQGHDKQRFPHPGFAAEHTSGTTPL